MNNQNHSNKIARDGQNHRKKSEKELNNEKLEKMLEGIRRTVAGKNKLQKTKSFNRLIAKTVQKKPVLDSKGRPIYGSDKSSVNKPNKKKEEKTNE